MDIIHLYVSVPVAGFRVAQAREFWETYPCPPPATVYGMLLSLVGETDRFAHQGAEVAVAMASEPGRSVVLRTLWRVKDTNVGPGLAANKKPDFQELLTDVRLSVWVRQGDGEKATAPLQERLRLALMKPGTVSRFGGLSLGESTHLVNDVRRWRQEDPGHGRLLIADETGDISMPVWPDHVGSKGTAWGQFNLQEDVLLPTELPEQAWITIHPPET